MPVKRYDPKTKKWRKLTKEEVIAESIDIENKRPCDYCWKQARDYGIYVWPLKPEALNKVKRCKRCGRVIA